MDFSIIATVQKITWYKSLEEIDLNPVHLVNEEGSELFVDVSVVEYSVLGTEWNSGIRVDPGANPTKELVLKYFMVYYFKLH